MPHNGHYADAPRVLERFRAQFHVAIVGAGLVGLALSIFLARAGFQVTVLERDAELRTIGAGIQMPANLNRVLEELGVLERVVAHAVEPAAISLYSWRGGPSLTRLELGGCVRRSYGVPHLVCHRADLRQILFDAACVAGARIRLGVKIVDSSTPSSSASSSSLPHGYIKTVGGKHDLHADLIVGADGEHSFCRCVLLGRPNAPKPSGRVANRALIDLTLLRHDARLHELVGAAAGTQSWLGNDCQVVGYTLQGVYNLVLTRPAASDELPRPGPQPSSAEEMREFFSDWDPRLTALLEHTHSVSKWTLFEAADLEDVGDSSDEGDSQHTAAACMDRLPSGKYDDTAPASGSNKLHDWVHPSGKLVLIGDAAHATPPHLAQGAAIGLESAAVLAHLLYHAESPETVPDLLRLFYDIRQPRTSHVRRSSKRMGDIYYMYDGPLQRERDRQLRASDGSRCTAHSLFLLADPTFQAWLWSYNAAEEVRRALHVEPWASVDDHRLTADSKL